MTTPRPWNHYSVVTCCDTCEGAGVIAHYRQPTTNDPYPERPCHDCDGEHVAECPVCGFGLEVSGYDCLACETIASLTDKDFAKLNDSELAGAIMRAAAMRRRSIEAPLPTASESTSTIGMGS